MDEVFELAALLGPERPEVGRLVRLAIHNPSFRPAVVVKLQRMCKKEGVDVANPDEFLPRPTTAQLHVPGGIDLARTLSHAPFLVAKEEAAKGILVSGQAGSGKTNWLYWLIEKLRPLGMVWVIDTPRRDYAGLAKFLGMRYIAKCHTCVNPLEPPSNTAVEHWFGQFAAVFAYAFRLGIASELFLYQMLRRTHAILAEHGRFPSLADVTATFENHKPRGHDEAGYLHRTLQKLRPLSLACPELTTYERGFDLSFFLREKENVIWEASEVEEFRTLATLFYAMYIFEYRVNNRV